MPEFTPNSHEQRLFKGLVWLALLALLALACSATDNLNLPFLGSGDIQGAVETGVYQTRQVSELQTAAAGEAGEAAAEATPDPALSCPAADPPPDFSTVTFPEGLGELEQREGAWYLNDTEVELVNHLNADCSATLWLTLAGQANWPLFIQAEDGGWDLGSSYWTGKVAIINTNEAPVTVSLLAADIASGDGSEPQVQELGPYEIFEFATLPPGRYAFSFTFVGDQAFDLSCALDLQPDSRYSFVAVPIGVAVFEASYESPSAADVDVTTSSLCTN